MLLNHRDLLVNESSIQLSPIDYASSNESIFEYGLECMRESNNEIRNILSGIMKESGYMVNESFKEEFNKRFNFNNIVSTIFKLFVGMIKKLYNKAKVIMLKILYQDKTIIKYKSLISSYDKQLEVSFDHYNFTYLDKDIPSSNLNLTFSAEYEALEDKLQKIGEKNNKEKIIFELNNLFNEIQTEINHGYYDKIRKSVLARESVDDLVFQDQYPTELFKLFRGGMDTPNGNDILPNEIHDTLSRFLKGKEYVKAVDKHRRDIEMSADKAKKNINRITVNSIMSDYVPIDYDIEFNLNRVLKLKCGQLSECCNIYTMAFSAKLTALRDSMIQDKKVLFAVINEIVMSGGGTNAGS